ncbi:MAG: hypothetical protein US83_C0003G0053 [Candidatus Falkowbacteria bacterium GW2011_GWC2_38_22]|uniref:Uncharacterized protein n=1 Tax=Candidatus Falkowbacteria bacterium GW2011_GWE1_38_31 TaxID=1618638 RepID=A0A0G0JUL8_9BACT|nr:MAG: hypothetical protein US73_C0001G0145 [Candidatus Falkowbacteria bacterium GW2011_GWF2_38_1205]KKQ61804.1 MAG: hypothetical protein US83_C0003G0053 [Candidatus Falkowbacteria bacterium GW2011_GWC2_38_22]KKQ64112.1 MAG: hypothetical protein US84_C0002G0144 [Candidatus Falkowbacteria bacterium GW2011_GWF1_38_22]KKQ66538.1 MAG: hypothetical protein US87_C0001G0059 [Candidatus Falkowbacteria bacterium GW2011_GWE2_38_254]KKQ71218.1 MAG: hypothetical protein US91_C0001G0145 [Candidatus Falkowb
MTKNNMFETSKDILNIVIASSIGLFTIFVCWAIYYFVQILRQGFKAVEEMRLRLKKIDNAIKAFKEKIEHSTSHIVLIAEGIKKLVEVIKERTEKGGEK